MAPESVVFYDFSRMRAQIRRAAFKNVGQVAKRNCGAVGFDFYRAIVRFHFVFVLLLIVFVSYCADTLPCTTGLRTKKVHFDSCEYQPLTQASPNHLRACAFVRALALPVPAFPPRRPIDARYFEISDFISGAQSLQLLTKHDGMPCIHIGICQRASRFHVHSLDIFR